MILAVLRRSFKSREMYGANTTETGRAPAWEAVMSFSRMFVRAAGRVARERLSRYWFRATG